MIVRGAGANCDAAMPILTNDLYGDPVSAAAKQQHQNSYNKDQLHKKSPLMVMTSNKELPTVD
jgi:hypothetical protein